MTVDMWMTRDPLTIAPTTAISAAALLMTRRKVRRLVVVDGEHRVVGMVSAGDIARAFPPDLNPTSAAVTDRSVPAPVATIMTRAICSVASGAAMEEAARLLRAHKIGAVPVVQGSRLAGIVTESDLFRALVEMSDPGEPGVRITFELDEGEDVVATMLAVCRGHHARIASLFSFHHRDARTGDRRRLGVIRLAGDVPEAIVDAVWRSRHRVLTVVRRAAAGDEETVRER
ncbi:MAG: CBS domain-containing protein [Deltaproteobacteria bacterium]|nr:CBS domain-containing protein [Deltaproteobacteria bacterium]